MTTRALESLNRIQKQKKRRPEKEPPTNDNIKTVQRYSVLETKRPTRITQDGTYALDASNHLQNSNSAEKAPDRPVETIYGFEADDGLMEAWKERAAIMEFNGGLNRDDAERLARELVAPGRKNIKAR